MAQEIYGNLVLTADQAPIYVFYNHVHRNLICYGNTPPPYNNLDGIGNTVDGRSVGHCATTNSPPTAADPQRALRGRGPQDCRARKRVRTGGYRRTACAGG